MEFTYIPTEYEIKLMVLYTVKNLKVPSDYTMLDFVISSCANVNYFELEKYITELMGIENLAQYTVEGENYYSITEQGEETLDFFVRKIPGSIRLALEEKIRGINTENAKGNKLSTDYIPLNENEYTVKLSMEEGGTLIMELEFYAGPKERAIAICSYLKNHNAEFYKNFMELVDKGVARTSDKKS